MDDTLDFRFLINKTEITEHTLEKTEIPFITDNEVLFRINKYAITTNNITYAVVGAQLKYWDFFPVNDTHGLIPVWGFGEVVASKNDSVQVGDSYYGYFPMCSYLKVEPIKISENGFADGTSHRQEMAPIYNFYEKTNLDSETVKPLADHIPIIRPLFATGFLSYYFLKEADFFNAENLILTSASSKTALAQAFMFKQNQSTDNKKIIGITSSKNKSFVIDTGLYDEIFSYDEISNLENKDSMIIDFAGRGELINQIFRHLGDQLKYASMIGLTDWQAERSNITFPKAKMFFAPSVAIEFTKKWGRNELMKKIGTEMVSFILMAKKWIKIESINDHESLTDLYDKMVDGDVDPSKGYLIEIK